jgi:hypothetical protein
VERSSIVVESLPGCGEFASWSMLRLTGQSVPLSEIRSRFLQYDANFDESRVSVAAVRQVLGSFGLSTDAVHYRMSKIAEGDMPMIMYFTPSRFPGLPPDIGHFMTATGVRGDALSVLDWSKPASTPNTEYPISFFESTWDGDAIICRRNEAKVSTIAWLVFAVMSSLFWIIQRRNSRGVKSSMMTKPPLTCLALCLLGSFSGCMGSKPIDAEAKATLSFIQPVANLGRVDSKELIHTAFEFNVPNGSSPVRIVDIKTACGCTTLDSDILNTDLPSGTNHSLELAIRPVGNAAQSQVVTAEVITVPLSPRPIVLAIRYRPVSRIQVSVSELWFESIPGVSQDREFTVTYHRSEGDPAVRLKPEKCDWGDLKLTSQSYDQTEISDGGVRLVTDETKIKLRLPAARDVGEKSSRIRLGFDRIEPVYVPVVVRVELPVKVVLDRLFLGKLKPSADFQGVLPWKSWSPEFGISRIESAEGMEAQLSDRLIQVRGTAPASSGRFTETIRIHCYPETLPVIEVPVSGIVEP